MPDFYLIFRWLLFVFVTIYFCITFGQFLWTWYLWLWQRDRYIGMLRRYLIVHGLRVRVRAFWGDAVVCALLGVVFLLMWACHVQLDAIARTLATAER